MPSNPNSPAGKEHVLITGGVGFVGTHLSRRLAQAGHRVRVLDLRHPADAVGGVDYVQGDARDAELVRHLVGDADVVYHLSATVSIPLCQADPVASYSNNLMATLCVLEAIRGSARARAGSAAGLIFASTAALYGRQGDDGRALREPDIASEFLSYYAAQKHASEKAIELYSGCYGIPAMVMRFFNIFGPGQDPASPYSGVITLFTRFAREGRPLPLNGGGTQTRDFISVHDIVSGIVRPLEFPRARWNPAPINLGTGASITVRELAQTISRVHGGRSPLADAPAREGDVLHSKADIARARAVLGFSPSHALAAGLKEI